MALKRKKTAAGAILVYTLLAGGSWMFINSYTNSFNRLTEKKIKPASLIVSSDSASVQVLNRAAHIDLRPILPESRLYYGAYIFSPDEIRSAAYLISFLHGN